MGPLIGGLIHKSRFSFAEKPGSASELEIAERIRAFFNAFLDKDTGRIISFFSEDATIESHIYKRMVGKGQYEEFLRKNIPNLRAVVMENIIVRPAHAGRASVYVDVLADYGFGAKPKKRLLFMEKKDNWYIVESKIF